MTSSMFRFFGQEFQKIASPLESTVEGFMGGLRGLAKGSAERGKYITQHMNHAPFLSSLQAHPQGKQIHAMLTSHLNNANAAFKPGHTILKAASIAALRDELEKISMSAPALRAAHFATLEGRVGARAGWDAGRVNKSLKRLMKFRPKAPGVMAGVDHAAPVEMLASSGPHTAIASPHALRKAMPTPGGTNVTRVGPPQQMLRPTA